MTTTYTRSVEVAAPVGEAFAFCNSADGFRRIFPGPVEWLGGPEVWGPGGSAPRRPPRRCDPTA